MSATIYDIRKEIRENNWEEVVRILRIKGNEHLAKEKSWFSNEKRLPIHIAIYFGTVGVLDVVKELVRIFPECIKEKTKHGSLPLHYLKWSELKDKDPEEFFKIAKYLLEMYPEALNGRDIHGDLPLHCLHNSVKLVSYLIEKYPNWIKTQNGGGDLPLHLFCRSNNTDAQNKILQLCLDEYPEGMLVNNAKEETPIERFVNYDFKPSQSGSKAYLQIAKAYKRSIGGISPNGHPILHYLGVHNELSKMPLRMVEFMLSHPEFASKEHNDNAQKIAQLEKEVKTEKDKSRTSEISHTRNIADLSRQLKLEKARVVQLEKSMNARILQARKLESGLLVKVLENNEGGAGRSLDALHTLAANMYDRLAKLRQQVVPQESPSSAQMYFKLFQKAYANDQELDREFPLQAIRQINEELLELKEKHGFSVDDNDRNEAPGSVCVETGTTRPLEVGVGNDTSPKRLRTISSTSVSI